MGASLDGPGWAPSDIAWRRSRTVTAYREIHRSHAAIVRFFGRACHERSPRPLAQGLVVRGEHQMPYQQTQLA